MCVYIYLPLSQSSIIYSLDLQYTEDIFVFKAPLNMNLCLYIKNSILSKSIKVKISLFVFHRQTQKKKKFQVLVFFICRYILKFQV